MNNEPLPVKNDIILQAKAFGVAQLFNTLAGVKPEIVDRGTYLQVQFSDDQKKIIHKYFENVLQSKPGRIRINWAGLTLPPLVKVYGRWLVIVLIVSYLLGQITAR